MVLPDHLLDLTRLHWKTCKENDDASVIENYATSPPHPTLPKYIIKGYMTYTITVIYDTAANELQYRIYIYI